MRRYDEPIAVRTGELGGVPAPVQFLWRERLWRVLDVERRWRETADWWVLRADASGAGEPDLLAESEVLRVVASSGRSSLPGVYELAHAVDGDAWVLRGVMD